MSISMNGELSGRRSGWAIGRSESSIRPVARIGSVFAFLILGLILLSGAAGAESESSSPPLDLNRATAEQLESLPGIGAVKAAAILAVRDTKGGFQSMEELEAVRGIGPALVVKLRPLVVVGQKRVSSAKPSRK